MAIDQTTRTRATGATVGGAPLVAVPGADPDRILLIGDEATVLAGATTHEAGLTGELARSLAGRSGRGAVVEALVRPGLQLSQVAALLPSVRLERFDAVALTVVNDDASGARRRELGALLRTIEDGASRGSAVLVAGVAAAAAPGLRGRLAARQDQRLLETTRAVVEARPHGVFVTLDGREEGADAIAAALAPVLAATASTPAAARLVRATPDDEAARVAALVSTGLNAPGGDARFAPLAERAKELLGGEAAVIGFIDSDTHWISAAAGADLEMLPRSISFCDYTIRSEAPFVVGDLAADERFVGNPMVTGDPNVRFYAGYPIESPDGYRIGSICVLGGTPRDPATIDVAALQTLAAEARAEIWSQTTRR